MTAQDRVYASFPLAEARWEEPRWEYGFDEGGATNYWAIFSGPQWDAEELGRGRDEFEAWSDAAGLRGNQAA